MAFRNLEALLVELHGEGSSSLEIGAHHLLATISVDFEELAEVAAGVVFGDTEALIQTVEATGDRLYGARVGVLAALAHGMVAGTNLERIRSGGYETHYFVHIAETQLPTRRWRAVYDGVHLTPGEAIRAAVRESFEMGNNPRGLYMAIEGSRVGGEMSDKPMQHERIVHADGTETYIEFPDGAPGGTTIWEFDPDPRERPCRVYWGSHGCMLERDHDGPHICSCAPRGALERGYLTADERADGNVGAPPYYSEATNFWGEDAVRPPGQDTQ